MNGKVILAKAVSGHPLLRTSAEMAARKTIFAPALVGGGEPFYVKASLLYKFNADRTIETNLTEKDSDVLKQKYLTISCGRCGSEPVSLEKPKYPKAASYVRVKGVVNVEILIDENGNVESAKVVFGHPLLRYESEKAALNSRFVITKISGKPVKVRGLIAYNFVL